MVDERKAEVGAAYQVTARLLSAEQTTIWARTAGFFTLTTIAIATLGRFDSPVILGIVGAVVGGYLAGTVLKVADVTGINVESIVVAVIGMARAFGCIVTAEGVETEEQLAVLKTLGCDRAQGFLLAEPFQASRKEQLPVTESVLEAGHELSAKYTAQNLNRQEERIARVYPALVIGR